MIDKSYLHCIQVQIEGDGMVEEVIGKLNRLCAPGGVASPTFSFKPALDGSMEMGTLLYRPGLYPRGFIGPALFSWSASIEGWVL